MPIQIYLLAELPGAELEREQATDALDTTDPDTDLLAAARAIENTEFDVPNVMPQDSQRYGTSEPQQNQDQNIEYEIIIEHNVPLLEPSGLIVEPDGGEPLRGTG